MFFANNFRSKGVTRKKKFSRSQGDAFTNKFLCTSEIIKGDKTQRKLISSAIVNLFQRLAERKTKNFS